jgi:hypothetical protein
MSKMAFSTQNTIFMSFKMSTSFSLILLIKLSFLLLSNIWHSVILIHISIHIHWNLVGIGKASLWHTLSWLLHHLMNWWLHHLHTIHLSGYTHVSLHLMLLWGICSTILHSHLHWHTAILHVVHWITLHLHI